MRFLVLMITTFSLLLISGCNDSSNEKKLEQIMAKTTEMRELTPKKDVVWKFMSKEELRARIIEESQEEYTQEDALIDQEIFVMMGLMSEGQKNLYDLLIDVSSEQTIGFYDTDTEELYVISDTDHIGIMEELVIAHEYTHALQDQYFDMDNLIDEVADNSDKQMARMALIEGDATRIDLIYLFSLGSDEFGDLFNDIEKYEGTEFDDAPSFVQDYMMFPYEEGINFITSIGDWESINKSYNSPPESTEQILHPEKYLDPSQYDEPQHVTMPDIGSALDDSWELSYEDLMGEFFTKSYLDEFLPLSIAEDAAAGWDGDKIEYWKNKDNMKLLAIYYTWDTIGDSEEFCKAYVSIMRLRDDGSWILAQEEWKTRWWQKDGTSIFLKQNQENTLILMADNETTVNQVLPAFSGMYDPVPMN